MVIITGAARTGSTILTRILSEVSNVCITNETGILALDTFKASFRLTHALFKNKPYTERIDRKRKELLQIVPITSQNEDQFWDIILEEGEDIYGDKHYEYLYMLDRLVVRYPDYKLIYTLRDPRDVWLSLVRHYNENSLTGLTNFPTLEHAINNTPVNNVGVCLNITKSLPYWHKIKHKYGHIEIRYEDMRLKHRAILYKLASYLNISYLELKRAYDKLFKPTHLKQPFNHKIPEHIKQIMGKYYEL